MRELLAELRRRDPVLASTGWVMVALLAVILLALPFDGRSVMGLNPWVKPLKFTFSFVIYLWTLAWFLGYLTSPRWALQTIRWGISSIIVVEFLCVSVQAARGTTSHYNDSGPFDLGVWALMSVGIMLNTALALLLWALFLRPAPRVPTALLLGIRIGLLVFVLGGLQGLAMVFGGAHTVGLADGGPGLPFLDWSTRAGDLRVAHILGLHGLQAIPLAGHLAGRSSWLRSRRGRIAAVWAFAFVYVLVAAGQFVLALEGRPLLHL